MEATAACTAVVAGIITSSIGNHPLLLHQRMGPSPQWLMAVLCTVLSSATGLFACLLPVGSFRSRSLSALHRLLIHPCYCHDRASSSSRWSCLHSPYTPDSDIARRGAGRGARTVVQLFILKTHPFSSDEACRKGGFVVCEVMRIKSVGTGSSSRPPAGC